MQFVKLEFVGAAASLTLQQAGGNRINFQMREEIFSAVNSVASSKARVLVEGDGENFCLCLTSSCSVLDGSYQHMQLLGNRNASIRR
jgi:hypothetical protein